jgi:hypothetical protein
LWTRKGIGVESLGSSKSEHARVCVSWALINQMLVGALGGFKQGSDMINLQLRKLLAAVSIMVKEKKNLRWF